MTDISQAMGDYLKSSRAETAVKQVAETSVPVTATPDGLCTECKKEQGGNARECDTCLKYLNYMRRCFQPMPNASVQANQSGAIVNLGYLLEVSKLGLDGIFIFQKRLEALTAEVATIYHTTKIKARIPDVKAAEAKAEEYNKAIKTQKIAQAPKKERKILSDRDKAVEALTSRGLDLKMAQTLVDAQMAKVGRVTGLEEKAK